MRIIIPLLALLPSLALAVPMTLQHQGRLLDSTGVPLDGPMDVTVGLYDAPSSGNMLWSETLSAEFDNGYFSIELGSGVTLDTDVFANDEIHVGMAIGTNSELPMRLVLHSVPFAIRAGTATNVSGGVVDATEIRINGTTVIDGDGMPATIGGITGCSVNQIPLFDGSNWGCTDNADPAHVHAATDITSGTLDIGLLPVGNGAGTVAPGDHGHGFTDLSGVASPLQLPVGNAAGQVAAGDHAHGFADLTGSAAISQLPVGTGASEIAAGDHSHTAADVGALPAGGGTLSGDLVVQGSVQVGQDTTTCDGTDASLHGILRWDANDLAMQACTDSGWVDLYKSAPAGTGSGDPVLSCKQLHIDDPSAPDGPYWIDPATTGTAYQVYCDMTTHGGGWTLLLRANGSAYAYDNPLWENTGVDNQLNPTPQFTDAKYQSYNDLPVEELMLVSELGNDVHLSIGRTGTLLSFMTDPAASYPLTVVAGSPTANDLVHGGTPTSICSTPYRINGWAHTNFQVRIGGFFNYTWNCNYGDDQNGLATGAESAGFGLLDRRWNPWTNGDRGFGIRQAHDATAYAGGNGQLSTGGLIYAR